MDVGSARFTGMVKAAYDGLRGRLGFGEPGAIIERMQQLVGMDERVLDALDVDVRAFLRRDLRIARAIWSFPVKNYGTNGESSAASPPAAIITSHALAAGRRNLRGKYRALRMARSDLPGNHRGLREQAVRLRKSGYAVMYNARFNIVHTAQYLRGFEDWYLDLGQNHELFRGLMQAITEVLVELNHRTLAEVGDLIDIVAFGDDVGLQDRPVCSLPMYRQLIRPAHERVVETIHAHTRAKILYHTCGSVYRYIEDFISIGIDALNPIQVRAKNMEPERLKREFGGRIVFWGGIDSQHVLPHGSPQDVADEVRRIFGILGTGGGYVLAAVHNIQPDVPPKIFSPCSQRAENVRIFRDRLPRRYDLRSCRGLLPSCYADSRFALASPPGDSGSRGDSPCGQARGSGRIHARWRGCAAICATPGAGQSGSR